MCIFCRSLFVLLYFFFWSLCCLFLFDMQILITPLVSSNSSSNLCIISIQNSLATSSNLYHTCPEFTAQPPKATYHTYPEFTGHIPKSLFIVIPSFKEIDTTILSSLKHLNHRTKSGFCFIKSIFLLTYMTSEVQDISEAYTHLILQITP